MKTVRKIIASQRKSLGEGQSVMSPLPNQWVDQISPFIMLDHFGPKDIPAGKPFFVPPHPHRGFEPVTILFEGKVEHKDSLGNSGSIKGGDVQWMTAGSGVIHSEGAPSDFAKTGGTLHLIQLWVNLPKRAKMSTPKYQDIPSGKIPSIKIGNATLRLIAGTYADQKGPAETFTPILLMHGIVKAGDKLSMAIPQNYHSSIFVTKGELSTDGYEIPEQHLVWYNEDNQNIEISAIHDSEFLLMAGEPIEEPIASYGPFVMNNKAEIIEAIQDYEAGKYGTIV
ncbi:MAG TPA: pirin family protein [Bacteroidia bacterium]|nr:pirin family protein [Bacteroidia bacterium]HQI43574.1 pirin family protein [Dysgonamonadaceae bacterium]